MTVILAATGVGALAGLHAATWGMFKDALYEGFSVRKYLRSVVTGALAAAAIQLACRFDLASAAGFVLLFGTTYALERFLLESWKSFLRQEDQSKYFIPMQLAVNGRIVRGRLARLLAGAGYAGAVALVIAALVHLQPAAGPSPLAALLLAGTVGGWISALGGAWKDAPKEGFQLLKFFRSPGIALGYSLLLVPLTSSLLVIAFGALGLTIATIETHKKFGRSDEPPGKFAGKAITHPEMLRRRRRFVPVYATIWAVVAMMLTASLVERAEVPLRLAALGLSSE